MRRMAVLLILMAGCSTAPVADVMDYFSPGRMDKAQVTPYGGVCQQPGKGPPINAIPIGGALPPPSLPTPGAVVAPPPGAVPAPTFPIVSPPPGGPLVPSAPPPGLYAEPPPGAAPVRPTSSTGGSAGAVLSLPAIDTSSPR
jgi:hypothetical protein